VTAFAIGCTHFDHARIIELCGRPFGGVEEMNEALVANWNRVVGPKDTVYHLGDFAFRGRRGQGWLDRLNGRIVRLQGNHDSSGWGPDVMEISALGRKVVLCHYPFEEWNGWHRGAVHLHAHTHSPEFRSAERRGNVGADAIGFTPIAVDEAVRRLIGEEAGAIPP
jgi:calcineurin-like phosphoesterase family protein